MNKALVDRIQVIMDNTKIDYTTAYNQLSQIKDELELNHNDEVLSVVHEAMGDLNIRVKKLSETEKHYREMLRYSKQLYETDEEKYDYRLGFSCYKIATFYRNSIGCANYGPNPKELSDVQQKIFQIMEINYNNAIACTMTHTKQGLLKYVELHATCMNELAVAYCAVGNYSSALTVAKDGTNLDVTIYENMKDKAHCFLCGNRLNTHAMMHMVVKNYSSSSKLLEKSIEVLSEHKDKEPITFGILLGKNYLALGNCYYQIFEKRFLAENSYLNGLDYMENVNVKTNNALIYDLISSYAIVGDYYRRENKIDSANKYYNLALKQSEDMYKKTNDKKYEAMITYLQNSLN